ncbi:MAG: SAM-dependent methyltransferase, partial [Solirubrobacteraceae bacterium]
MPFARTGPLRRELALALPERPFAIRFWDGSSVPATVPGGPTFEIHSPRALAHALRAPGELGLGRAYVVGLIDVDDIEKALRIVDTFQAPTLSPGRIAKLGVALVQAVGLMRLPPPPASELRLRGERHTIGR